MRMLSEPEDPAHLPAAASGVVVEDDVLFQDFLASGPTSPTNASFARDSAFDLAAASSVAASQSNSNDDNHPKPYPNASNSSASDSENKTCADASTSPQAAADADSTTITSTLSKWWTRSTSSLKSAYSVDADKQPSTSGAPPVSPTTPAALGPPPASPVKRARPTSISIPFVLRSSTDGANGSTSTTSSSSTTTAPPGPAASSSWYSYFESAISKPNSLHAGGSQTDAVESAKHSDLAATTTSPVELSNTKNGRSSDDSNTTATDFAPGHTRTLSKNDLVRSPGQISRADSVRSPGQLSRSDSMRSTTSISTTDSTGSTVADWKASLRQQKLAAMEAKQAEAERWEREQKIKAEEMKVKQEELRLKKEQQRIEREQARLEKARIAEEKAREEARRKMEGEKKETGAAGILTSPLLFGKLVVKKEKVEYETLFGEQSPGNSDHEEIDEDDLLEEELGRLGIEGAGTDPSGGLSLFAGSDTAATKSEVGTDGGGSTTTAAAGALWNPFAVISETVRKRVVIDTSALAPPAASENSPASATTPTPAAVAAAAAAASSVSLRLRETVKAWRNAPPGKAPDRSEIGKAERSPSVEIELADDDEDDEDGEDEFQNALADLDAETLSEMMVQKGWKFCPGLRCKYIHRKPNRRQPQQAQPPQTPAPPAGNITSPTSSLDSLGETSTVTIWQRFPHAVNCRKCNTCMCFRCGRMLVKGKSPTRTNEAAMVELFADHYGPTGDCEVDTFAEG
ncbi:hypothetical protein BJ742DRAFT_462127 [Cladochytrium replicatum]|nr:hypothetical protein BJ742DRAFT_462127 [Cladochytrium replicatum]